MRLKNILLSTIAVFSTLFIFSSCRKTIELGKQPIISFVEGADLLSTDGTLTPNKKYFVRTKLEQSEDLSPNTSFEISRTYNQGLDTSVFYVTLKDADQNLYEYTHNFTTLKNAGTEKFTFTVKNDKGIVNQKILTFTVK
jgi:hypothetical protein